jgi:hypothetical protein
MTTTYAGSSGIRGIISDLERNRVHTSPIERGVLRNVAAKTERVEKAAMLSFFNSLRPADLAKIGTALTRLEKRANLNEIHATMVRLKMDRIENRRDLQSLRQIFARRR